MEPLTRKQRRLLWGVIELNLLLWLIVAGAVWHSSAETHVKQIVGGGFLVAILAQHWGYCSLCKMALRK